VGILRRGRVSEEIAARFLEELGFEIVERYRKVLIEGVEVGEVDIVARDRESGELYAVEVKAGRVDVSGIRQAYVNAQLLSMKPMVVCRGFADDAAMKLANELGVKIVTLSDLALVDPLELYTIVKDAVESSLLEVLEVFTKQLPELSERDMEAIEAIASSETFKDAADRLRMSVEKLAKYIVELRNRGVPLYGRSFREMKVRASLLLIRLRNLGH